MFQALPVATWFSIIAKNNTAVEMNDGTEKEDYGNDNIDKNKEKIILGKYTPHYIIRTNSSNLHFITSENAVILHHAEVCTPPPNNNS